MPIPLHCPLPFLSLQDTQRAHLRIFEEAKIFKKLKQSDTVLHDNKNCTPQKAHLANSIRKLRSTNFSATNHQATTRTPVQNSSATSTNPATSVIVKMAGIKYQVLKNAAKAKAVLNAIQRSPQFTNYDATVKHTIQLCVDAFAAGINDSLTRAAFEFIAFVAAANKQGCTIDKYDNLSRTVFYNESNGTPNFRAFNYRLREQRLDATVKEFAPKKQLDASVKEFVPSPPPASPVSGIEEATSDSGYESSAPGTPAGSFSEVSNASDIQQQQQRKQQQQQESNIAWLPVQSNPSFSRFAHLFEQTQPGYEPTEAIVLSGTDVEKLPEQLNWSLNQILDDDDEE